MQGRACLAIALSLAATTAGPTACLSSVSVVYTFDGEAHAGGLGYPAADVGDFNGDTYADWAAYTDEASVNVYFGGAAPDTIPDLILRAHCFSSGFLSRLAGTCDFNGDGLGDIVLASGKRAYIYLGSAVPDAQWDLQLNWNPEGYYVFLASVGDFNGDGCGDIVAADASAARVYLGGNPPDGDADLTLARGCQVAGLGDANGDGYDDIAVGAGPTHLYFGSSVPDTSADLVIWGPHLDMSCPDAISGAGDFNGDGFADLVVGAPEYDSPAVPGSHNGMISVYFGGSPMDTIVDWFAREQSGSAQMGFSVACAGDVNNDDFDDLLVGAPDGSRAYVFHGGAAPDTIRALCLIGVAADDRFGFGVAGLGDVDGDATDDVLVAPAPDGDHVQLYLGGATMDSIADLVITDEVGHELGYTVAEAGDLNGDTYGDWAIGAPWGLGRGSAYVYFGGASPDTVRDLTIVRGYGFGADLDPAGDVRSDGYDDLLGRPAGCGDYVYVYYGGTPMDSVFDKKLSTDPSCGDAGTVGMAKGGDFNGDGYGDVLVGVLSFVGAGWTELYYGGARFDAYPDVYFTSFECAGGGNLNGDAFADALIGEPHPWTGNGKVRIYMGGASVDTLPDPAYVLEGPSEYFGMRVAFAGDLNGDSFDDILVSCSGGDHEDGDVYVYFGGPGMDTFPDLTLTSPGLGSGFGSCVERLGDINGDLYDDVAIGAPWAEDYKGQVLIYFGGSPTDADADIILVGEYPEDRFGFSIAGTDDPNGDGKVEFLVGAPGYDDNRGIAYMYAASYAGVLAARPDTKPLAISEVSPNPLAGRLRIKCSVERPGIIRADLFDVTGKVVRSLVRESAPPGEHVLEIDLEKDGEGPIAPGVYFIRLSHGGESRARKVVIAE